MNKLKCFIFGHQWGSYEGPLANAFLDIFEIIYFKRCKRCGTIKKKFFAITRKGGKLQTIVGHCPKCGSPIYVPAVCFGVNPPPNQYSCNCQ